MWLTIRFALHFFHVASDPIQSIFHSFRPPARLADDEPSLCRSSAEAAGARQGWRVQVSEVASAITPVPGGVGPMTIASLLHNTLEAARLHAQIWKRP